RVRPLPVVAPWCVSRPVGVRVPVPVVVRAPPVPPPDPPSCRTPENVVDRLLPPTARLFDPRRIVPAPSIEPAVMPPLESNDRSMLPVAPLMRRAVPPVLLPVKNRPRLLVMVALPAVLLSSNS